MKRVEIKDQAKLIALNSICKIAKGELILGKQFICESFLDDESKIFSSDSAIGLAEQILPHVEKILPILIERINKVVSIKETQIYFQSIADRSVAFIKEEIEILKCV
jgi:hypothetical protein